MQKLPYWVLKLPLGLSTRWRVDFISLSSFVYLATIIPLLMTLLLFCSVLLLIAASDSFAASRNVRMKRRPEIWTFYTLALITIFHSAIFFLLTSCTCQRFLLCLQNAARNLFSNRSLPHQKSRRLELIICERYADMLMSNHFSNMGRAERISTITHIWGDKD